MLLLFSGESLDGLRILHGRISFGAIRSCKVRVALGGLRVSECDIRARLSGARVFRTAIRGEWWLGATIRRCAILDKVAMDGLTVRPCRVGFSVWAPAAYSYRYLIGSDDVTGLVADGLSITFAGDRIHNEISFSSISADLRRKVVVGSRFDVEISGDFAAVYRFVIERISGDQVTREYSGRSISALSDTGETSISGGEIASVLAAGACPGVIWDAVHFRLPDDYRFSGTPIECLSDLAGVPAAGVRCDPDGGLRIRKRFPVRPVSLSAAVPDLRLDDPEIIGNPSGEWQSGTGEGRVFVYGYSSGAEPETDVESGDRSIGADAGIRVWWQTATPPGLTAWASSGTIIPTAGAESLVIEEDVTFEDGPVSLGKPVVELIGQEWYGSDGGAISWDRYGKEITAENIPAIGRVKYRAEFQRLIARGHSVERLLVAIDALSGIDTSAEIVMGENDPVFPAITDARIPSLAVAVERGTAELDAVRYDRHEVEFSADYHPDLWDGAVVYLGHDANDMAGNYLIEGGSYTFNGPQIRADLSAVKFR